MKNFFKKLTKYFLKNYKTIGILLLIAFIESIKKISLNEVIILALFIIIATIIFIIGLLIFLRKQE